MPFRVQGYVDDHQLTATLATETEALVKALEWFATDHLSDIAIDDGFESQSITDFAAMLKRRRLS